jgi:DNA-directed RNA polymerase specialized sigma24 family protein
MAVNPVSNPPSETPEQMLARLLRCPKLKASVYKVARSQGVHASEWEDVYQVTLERMAQATLPVTDADARKYVNGIAKNASIDHLRKKATDEATDSLESLRKEPSPTIARLEQRVFLQGLFRAGLAKFGEKWDWWVRSKIHKETTAEIGHAAGVTPGHVRDQVSLMNRWFDGKWGKRTGIGGVLVLLLAIGAGKWALTPHAFDESQLSTYSEVRTGPRIAAPDAAALRERARGACDAGAWGACENDLVAAAKLDPAGDTPEMQQMQLDARSKQMRFDADAEGPPVEMNAKPPR